MFSDIHALAQKTPLSLMITAIGDELRVIVQPCPHNDGESPEPKSNGLTHPLALQGTPKELDEKFAELIDKFTAARNSLEAQLEEAELAIKAAAEEAALKKKGAVKGKTKPPTTSPSTSVKSPPDSSSDKVQDANTSKKEAEDKENEVTQKALTLF